MAGRSRPPRGGTTAGDAAEGCASSPTVEASGTHLAAGIARHAEPVAAGVAVVVG